MAQCPKPIDDVIDLQFHTHNKSRLFNFNELPKNEINLLATASSYGIVFVGYMEPKIIVLPLSAITNTCGKNFPSLEIILPSNPLQIAVSSDDSLLAVEIGTNTGKGFIIIYSIPSVLTDKIVVVDFVRIPEQNVRTKQLLWNPVINNLLAVCLNNGKFGIYTVIDGKNTLNCLDSPESIHSASWSPKGKQIIAGFSNGNMIQLKPDLKTARFIACPPNIIKSNTKFIAIQWLSTYQFAAVFAADDEPAPCLYIINAPKIGNPIFIKYDDICYSQNGPRPTQVYLIHVQAWNLLLMSSSNSSELGVIGTTESGDTPTWSQWFIERRAEIPFYVRDEDSERVDGNLKQESFPIGFCLETGATHHIKIDPDPEMPVLPVMPMIHIFTTHGELVTSTMANIKPTYIDICSPPRPINPAFQWNRQLLTPLTNISPELNILQIPQMGLQPQLKSVTAVPSTQQQPQPQHRNEISFSIQASSTPTSQKSSLFGPPKPSEPFEGKSSIFGGMMSAQQTPSALFGGQPQQQKNLFGTNKPSSVVPSPFTVTSQPATITSTPTIQSNFTATIPSQLQFGSLDGTTGIKKPMQISNPVGNIFGAPANVTVQSTQIIQPNNAQIQSIESSTQSVNPLITVPPVYTKQKATSKSNLSPASAGFVPSNISHDNNDDNDIIKVMIQEEIQNFERELNELLNRSKSLNINIGKKEESANLIKNLNELQDVSNQATESTDSLTSEIETLRLSLNEAFSMTAEVKTKYSIFSDPTYIHLHDNASKCQTSQRQLNKLQSELKLNEIQFNEINKQLCYQRSNFDEEMKKNSRDRMQIPSLEIVYQTMNQQRNILNKQKQNIAMIKHKLGLKAKNFNRTKEDVCVESLTDSIVSMSLAEQVKSESSKLTNEKLKTLRDLLSDRKVVIVRSTRPERRGLNSEVIREKRLQTVRVKKTTKIMQNDKKQQQKQIESQNNESSSGWVITQQQQEHYQQQNTNINQANQIPSSGTTFSPRFGLHQTQQQQPQYSQQPILQKINTTPKSVITQVLQNNTIKPVDFKPDQPNKTSIQSDNNKGMCFDNNKVITPTSPSPFTMTPKFTINQTDNSVFDVTKFGLGSSVTIEKIGKDKINKDDKENVFKSVSPFSVFGSTNANIFNKTPTSIDAQTPLTQSVKPTTAPTPFSISNIFSSKTNPENLTQTGNTETKSAKNVLRQFLTNDANKETSVVTTPVVSSPITTTLPSFGGLTFGTTPNKETETISTAIQQKNESTVNDQLQTSNTNELISSTVTFSFIDNNKQKDMTTTSPTTSADIGLKQNVNSSIFSGFTESVTSATTPLTPVTPIPTSNIFNTTPVNTNSTNSNFNFGSLNFGTTTPSTSATTFSNTAPTTTTPSTTTIGTTDNANNLFQGLTVCKPETKNVPSTTGKTENIFAVASAAMPQSSSDTASSIFSAAAATFGTTPVTSASDTTKSGFFGTSQPEQTPTSISASSPLNSSASWFNGANDAISKQQEQKSIFGMSASTAPLFGGNSFGNPNSQNAFGGSNDNSNSPFGGSAQNKTTNVFGNGSVFGGQKVESSPFGSGGTTQAGNIFSSAAAAASDNSSIFGGSSSSNVQSTGSIFDMAQTSTPSSVGSSLFRSPTITNASSGGSLFGSTPGFGSGVGNTASPQSTGGSIFGGGGNSQQMSGGFGSSFGPPQTSPPPAFGNAFGQASTGFGSSSFGSPSTGFGQPQAQKFGSSATFGGAATFSSATFGNASFGSPKSSFGTENNSFNAPVQQNTLFEQLGASTESQMSSFGNLAQTSNTNQQKPAFGGSAFTAWR